MKTTKDLIRGERYQFDFGPCTVSKGFAQLDTKNDAPYFGMWASVREKKIISFVEGDLYVTIADTIEEFCAEMRRTAEFYGSEWLGIDTGFNRELAPEYEEIGLGDLLH